MQCCTAPRDPPRWPRRVRSARLAIVSSRFDGAPDGEVARAVAAGEGAAAEATLVARFARRVFLYGVRHLGDDARADDLAQDVMTTVIERLRAGAVREPDRIGSFVLGTARLMARDTRRREQRAAELATAAALEQDHAVAPRERPDLERLAEALAALPERERAVVVMSFQDDRSAQEIGAAFGLQPGHVRVLRHRAITRLGELMGVAELRDREAP